MQYRKLGRTDLTVSVIGIGTWQLGGEWGRDFTQAEVDAIFDAARAEGITLVDTSRLLRPAPIRVAGRRRDPPRSRGLDPGHQVWFGIHKMAGAQRGLFGRRHGTPAPRQPASTAHGLHRHFPGSWCHAANGARRRAVGRPAAPEGKRGDPRHRGQHPIRSTLDRTRRHRHGPDHIQPAQTAPPKKRFSRFARRATWACWRACRWPAGCYPANTSPASNGPRPTCAPRVPRMRLSAIWSRSSASPATKCPPASPMAGWALAWCLRNPAVAAVIPGCKSPEQLRANAAAAALDIGQAGHPQAIR